MAIVRNWKAWPVGSVVALWELAIATFREQWPKDRLVAILAFVGTLVFGVFAAVVLPVLLLYQVVHDILHALARYLAR